MGKLVSTEFECDATNCGAIGGDEADFHEVDLRLTSFDNPGVEKATAILCTNHRDLLENTLRDNFGTVLK